MTVLPMTPTAARYHHMAAADLKIPVWLKPDNAMAPAELN